MAHRSAINLLCSAPHVRHLPPQAASVHVSLVGPPPGVVWSASASTALRRPGQHLFREPLFTHSMNVSTMSQSLDLQLIDHTPLFACPSHFLHINMFIPCYIHYFPQAIPFKYPNFSFQLLQAFPSFTTLK